MESKNFSPAARLKSFKYAFAGISILIKSQHNAWLHAVATLVVCFAGFYFQLTALEWRWLVLAIILVWAAEALNTAIEFLADAVSPDHHPLVAKSKDVAAAAVLIAALGAVIIGLLIFIPHIITYLQRGN